MPSIGIPNPFLNFYTNGLNMFYGKREFSVSLSCFFHCIFTFILLHEKFLQFDWLRAVVFQLNLKYLRVKITNLLWVVV